MPTRSKSLVPILLLAGTSLSIACGQALAQNEELMPPVQCNDAVYRFLPGDSNYCLAAKMWRKGNYRQGEEFLLLAAGWGSKPAQYALGIAYFNGDGVAQNRPLGLAWLGLSSERGESDYMAALNSAYAATSVEERGRANTLYASLMKTYQDDVAAVRAKRKFDREISAMAGNPAYQPKVCISGLNSGPLSLDLDIVSCQSAEQAVQTLSLLSRQYFEGWKSTVDVGPVVEVKGDAARISKPAGDVAKP